MDKVELMLYSNFGQLPDFKKQARRRLGIFLVVFSVAVASVVGFLSTVSAQEQRHFVYRHSPRSIPELRMVRVKGLESDEWLNELKIEYKNVSEKPIYYISIYLVLFEAAPSFGKTHFKMEFGNSLFIDHVRRATSDDSALKPGESFVFQIPKHQIDDYKKALRETFGRELPKGADARVELDLYHVEFGDGTGYTAGELLPRKR